MKAINIKEAWKDENQENTSYEVVYRDYYGNKQVVASFRYLVEAEKYIQEWHKLTMDRYSIKLKN